IAGRAASATPDSPVAWSEVTESEPPIATAAAVPPVVCKNARRVGGNRSAGGSFFMQRPLPRAIISALRITDWLVIRATTPRPDNARDSQKNGPHVSACLDDRRKPALCDGRPDRLQRLVDAISRNVQVRHGPHAPRRQPAAHPHAARLDPLEELGPRQAGAG